MAGLKQQKKVKAQVVEEEEVAAVKGAMAVQRYYHVHAPQCWFGGKRVSKAKAFNNEQEKYLGQRISTARLARVQEAMKQLKENNRVGAEKASGGAASCSSRKTP